MEVDEQRKAAWQNWWEWKDKDDTIVDDDVPAADDISVAKGKIVTFSTTNDLHYVSHLFDLSGEDYHFICYNNQNRERWNSLSIFPILMLPGKPFDLLLYCRKHHYLSRRTNS
jgi:hypothetical protein